MEKIIERKKDRTTSGEVAAVPEGSEGDCSNPEPHELNVLGTTTPNARCRGFVAAATKRSRDSDERAAQDGLAAGGPPSTSVRVDDVGGKGGSGKKEEGNER